MTTLQSLDEMQSLSVLLQTSLATAEEKSCSVTKVGNSLKMKVYPHVSSRPALHVGDILTDLAEQRQNENNPVSDTALHSNLF